jgi:hypothetical protein
MDHDILQVKTFSAGSLDAPTATQAVDVQVNKYLMYNADLVYSIQPMMVVSVVDGVAEYQYTVMVTLRS